jgi:hypothetical protein
MTLTFDNGFALTGYLQDSTIHSYLIKLDSNGDSVWTKYFRNSPPESVEMVIECYDHGFMLAGGAYKSDSLIDSDTYIIKTDQNGDTVWTRTYSRFQINNYEIAKGIKQISDSIYFISGYSWNPSNNSYDVFLIKLNDAGDTIWTKLIGDSLENTSECIQQINDSSVIICGLTYVPGNIYDAYLAKLNFDGDTIWTKKFGGNFSERAYWVEIISYSGFVVCGSTESNNIGSGPGIYVLKTDSEGKILTYISNIIIPSMEIEFYPNPFTIEGFLVAKDLNHSRQLEVRIQNISGEIVRYELWDSTSPLTIRKDNLAAGIYILTVSNANICSLSKRIIIN